ncbi:S9 family peptidase [Candidatus Pelagibacter sp.]|jgi:oligopeptidase B|nr:S9 family peptidase [Candidatus Pelagibacter sp.]MDA9880021.1 S9 family peptidase [Candidatus Pelagibacter sp.]MDB9717299.1 S9 family peptidase [Candidatus Pelagibacter sp.]MDC0235330.1 S9 family peptidase [Candidatus Pelagibacter sp.]|tara:strand:+ start:1760 stop:3835 length:2076 start_codon:yes stop_codon:yes gene_type:complete
MKIPYLKKKPELKSYHNVTWEDNYSWIHQKNILEVLRDKTKLDPEVKNYLDKENSYADYHLKDTKNLQKKLFDEIKARIKLDDESLPYKDHTYEYWSKTTAIGNYSIKLRKKIDTDLVEEIWNGDEEKKKLETEYFGVGDLEVSNNDKYLGYSLDTKGSEYYTIFIRDIKTNKIITKEITETSGGITFSLDDRYVFYSKLDQNHRARKIYRHEIGNFNNQDELIFEEKSEAFTVSIGLSSDEKYYFINTSDHNTSEQYYFGVDEINTKPKLIMKREKGIIYSVSSWDNKFYNHTNKDAEDFKIDVSDSLEKQNWETFIPPRDEVLIGGCTFLKNWIIRSETSNALDKLFVKNISSGVEEELIFSNENVYVPGISLTQRNRDTDNVYLGYSSPKTPSRVYSYNLSTKAKKLVKEQEIPSGHNPEDYIVERVDYKSHDGRLVPLTITRHKKTKIDGSANLLLYGYGSYGSSMSPNFSSTRLSLINRDIIWATAHIRGGMEKGMKWWKEGKLTNKKNTFEDYIHAAKYLIDNNYSSKGKIIGMGGSAGGLLMGAVVNQAPELFLGIIMAVPFVDSLTTNLDHSLPLTVGEFDEFGNAKDIKEHFDYIFSYAPYNNIKKMDYPHILITTSLSDNRVLFDEPAKFTAKLREYKTDNNLLLLKTEMNAGHGGKSGRDGAIEEIAIDYAFALKVAEKI